MVHLVARWRALLAGVWAGLLLGVGAVGAPAGFVVATSDVAGRMAGRMFAIEARVSIAFGLVLISLGVWAASVARQQSGRASIREAQFVLPALAVLCTLIGYDLMQPLMAEARAGRGQWSFGLLHGLSAALFATKTLLVLALAWRLTVNPPGRAFTA